jgi:hypothetical protein
VARCRRGARPRLPRRLVDQVRLSPLELLDRLARLIPPPRVHRHRYHGVFAPNAKWRREATRYGREETGTNPPQSVPDTSGPTCPHATDRGPRRRWAQLLTRIYEVHPLRCPDGHRREALVSGRRASSPSSPTPASSAPSCDTCGSQSIRPRSVRPGPRRRPNCSRCRPTLTMGSGESGEPRDARPRPLRSEPARRRQDQERLKRSALYPSRPGHRLHACCPTSHQADAESHPPQLASRTL